MIRTMLRRVTGDRWPAVQPGEELPCREVGRRLQRYLDDELEDPNVVDGLTRHLEECARCGLEADTYRRMKQALAARRVDLPSESVERLRAFGAGLVEGADD